MLFKRQKKNKRIEKSKKKSYNKDKEKGLATNKSHVAVLRTVADIKS